MQFKRGTRFIHEYWMDIANRPLLCEVTVVRQGAVYWRPADSTGKAHDYFLLENAERHVRRVLL